MSDENETLRWPGNLDHRAIVERLAEIRNSAQVAGHLDLAARFADVENSSVAQIGTQTISTLIWIQDKPEYGSYATPLGIIAMNLKNLRQPGKP